MGLLLSAMTAGLQAGFNRLISIDQDAAKRLRELTGRVLALQLTDVNLIFYVLPTQNEVEIFSQYDGEVDTTVIGSTLDLLMMGWQKEPGDALFAGDVQIQGDTETGQTFQDILRSVDFDWEEQLSKVSGDIVAHKVGNTLRGVLSWGKTTMNTIELDLSEYLQFETQSVASARDVQKYINDVDALRDDAERLQFRIKRLSAALHKQEETEAAQ